MIHVIATITIKPGKVAEFIEVFEHTVEQVRAEKGCIDYTPCIDECSGYSTQGPVRENVVTNMECWKDMDAFHAHQKYPHMREFEEATKDLIESVSIQVVRPATEK